VSYKRVRLADDRLDHIVKVGEFFDGNGKALCGRASWPGKWLESEGRIPRVLCMTCKEKFRA
jgi:hypothetical protein